MLEFNIKQEPLRGMSGMGGGIHSARSTISSVLPDAVVNPYLELALIYGTTNIDLVGLSPYRYFRYQTHSNQSHFPRSSRLVLKETSNVTTTIASFVSDNCSDNGTIPTDGSSYTFDYGSPRVIDEASLYSVFNGGDRTASMALYGSMDNSNWTLLASGRASNTPIGSSSSTCGLVNNGLTYFSDYSYRIKGSGQGKKAKVSGSGVQFTTAQKKYYSGSMEFNSTSWVDVEGTFLTQTNWTIEAWLYKSSSAGMDLLTIDGNNCSFFFGSTSISCDGNGVGRVNTPVTIPSQTWFHFAMTKSGSTYKTYINGVEYLPSTTGGGIPSGSLSLGNTRSDNNVRWNGYIQEFKIFDGIVKYTGNFTPPGSTFGI